MPEVTLPTPSRRPPATRVAVDPGAARSKWIEAFYLAEAKAQLSQQTISNQRRTR